MMLQEYTTIQHNAQYCNIAVQVEKESYCSAGGVA
jgi:hypothetical protein